MKNINPTTGKRKYTKKAEKAVVQGIKTEVAAEKAGTLAVKAEVGSDFLKSMAPHKGDAVVKAYMKARKTLFAQGSSVDTITNLLKSRIKELDARTNIIH